MSGTQEVVVEQDGDYVHVNVKGRPGGITIKASSEGYVIDVWSDNHESLVDTMCVFFDDLENIEE